jgi:hypothetical protein
VDGRFEIDSKDLAGRKKLALHLNDNIFKNIDRFSIKLYSDENENLTSERLLKTDITGEKEKFIEDYVKEDNDKDQV